MEISVYSGWKNETKHHWLQTNQWATNETKQGKINNSKKIQKILKNPERGIKQICKEPAGEIAAMKNVWQFPPNDSYTS